jgi:GH24 family phage-related lysozyme (muramidase)
MRDSVAAEVTKFQTRFEGALNFMYSDVKGLVTTGVGNLIDPIGAALGLPWKQNSDNSLASQQQIADEWNNVKSRTDLDPKGGGAFRSITTLHLDQADIDALVNHQASSNEALLREAFPDWDNMPADGQLGILSMAWMMGAGFPRMFPKFTAAVNAKDWATAAAQSTVAGNYASRNAANKLLFQNADKVQRGNGDFETLFWPVEAPASGGGTFNLVKPYIYNGIAVLMIGIGSLIALRKMKS